MRRGSCGRPSDGALGSGSGCGCCRGQIFFHWLMRLAVGATKRLRIRSKADGGGLLVAPPFFCAVGRESEPRGQAGGRDAVGRLGGWAVGRLGAWALGRLGAWAVGRLGGLALGRSGAWAVWRLGGLALGRSGAWAVWRLGGLALGRSGAWAVWRLGGLALGRSGTGRSGVFGEAGVLSCERAVRLT